MSESVDIEVRDISKSYGKTVVLEHVSFTVPAGTTLALLGPSGCGKSTTLAIVAGITVADAGEVRFGGKNMNDVAVHRRGVGVVFQSYALFPHMTVQRNVEFGPRSGRKPAEECVRLAEESMALTHLSELRDRLPRQLSGGQRQRVAIARALASRPQVLLLDEPLSSLDASLREEMQFEISDLQKQTGISMIFVTHDQQEAMAVGDQVGVLVGGAMRQVGRSVDLYDRPLDLDVARFLGKANLLPVTVSALQGTQAELVGPGGERWKGVLPAAGVGGARPGGAAVVMVRPEAFRIVPAAGNSNSIRGVVKRATFLGREANVLIDVGSTMLELRSRASEGAELHPGMELVVEWDDDQSVVYDPPTDQTTGPRGVATSDESVDSRVAAT